MASTVQPDSRDRPGPHPGPPADLDARALPTRSTAEPWFRVHPAGLGPIFFGRTGRHRFDAPGGEFGALYLGQDEHCVFIETFGHETGEMDFVTWSALEERHLSRIEIRRPLRLVDLSGPGLARLGADARLTTGSVVISQRWALGFFQHPEQPDGIFYRSRHDPTRFCAVVFDRARDAVDPVALGSFADTANRRLLAEVLNTYEFGLIET